MSSKEERLPAVLLELGHAHRDDCDDGSISALLALRTDAGLFGISKFPRKALRLGYFAGGSGITRAPAARAGLTRH